MKYKGIEIIGSELFAVFDGGIFDIFLDLRSLKRKRYESKNPQTVEAVQMAIKDMKAFSLTYRQTQALKCFSKAEWRSYPVESDVFHISTLASLIKKDLLLWKPSPNMSIASPYKTGLFKVSSKRVSRALNTSGVFVKSWIGYAEANEKEDSVGGMGGFFNFSQKGQRWKDYLARQKPDDHSRIEAIRKSVLRKRLRLTGDEHQHSPSGVPLFNDDTVGTFSMRGWGDLMAAIWSEEEDKDYSYIMFYM